MKEVRTKTTRRGKQRPDAEVVSKMGQVGEELSTTTDTGIARKAIQLAMTFDELREEVDKFVGLESTVEDNQQGETHLVYRLPTGIVLLEDSYQQWAAMGCQVKKRPDNLEPGQWGTGIVFFKPIRKTVVNDETGEEQEERFGVLRTYTVFNADQVSGAERFQVTEEPGVGNTEPDYGPAEELIAATGADIRHGGEQAFYNPVGDFIQLPNRERFGSLGAFYETALHELAHWSEPQTALRPR